MESDGKKHLRALKLSIQDQIRTYIYTWGKLTWLLIILPYVGSVNLKNKDILSSETVITGYMTPSGRNSRYPVMKIKKNICKIVRTMLFWISVFGSFQST